MLINCRLSKFLLSCFLIFSPLINLVHAENQDNRASSSRYKIGPGDVLEISVWKEPDLEKRLVVLPDGVVSFPLMGSFKAENKTIDEIQDLITTKLEKVLVEPIVSVSLLSFESQQIYVIGKVNRPGAFTVNGAIDVMQALSLAGGMATFADQDSINILRRENGKLTAIQFDYSDIENGEKLEQNIILKKGDVVVVP